MQKIWQVLRPKTNHMLGLMNALGISSLLAHLLVSRQIENPDDAERFLNPMLSDLHAPSLFKDMEKAVRRIKRAVENKERILIYGDYDVDGITAMTVLIRTLKTRGADLDFYIPHRIEEGYGISEEGVRFAIENRISLVITVDCGIADVSRIEDFRRAGIEVIITDHHEPDYGRLPVSACAIINPLYPGETYPDKNLSGVGVAFKLARAVLGETSGVDDMLDLVALGTVADVCPLRGENRILVKYGLTEIGNSKKPGIKALREVADISRRTISANDVSFILGPRINAMGRLDSAELALRLFLTDSLSEGMEIAETLNAMNRKRQEIEETIYNAAVNRIEREINFKDEYAIVLGDSDWHQGVIGIVAGKLAERYFRPVILFSLDNKIASGSGRVKSGNIHLFKLLDKCRHLIGSFGGHKSACGIKMQEELIPHFRSRLNQAIREMIDGDAFTPMVYIDGELGLDSLGTELIAEFERLAPFGEGNPFPNFVCRQVRLKDKLTKRNGRSNSAVWVTDGRFTYQAKGRDFVNAVTLLNPEEEFDLVYQPRSLNRMGEQYIYLNVQDFRLF